MSRLANVRVVAGHDLLDLRRQRGVWSGLLLIPFITVSFLLLLPGVLAERQQQSQAKATYRIAVEAVGAGEVDELIDVLALPARLTAKASDDVRADVLASRADVGLRFEPGALASLRAEGSATGEAVVVSSRTSSRLAFGEVAGVIDARGLRLVEARLAGRGVAPTAARPFVVEEVDLSTSPRGRRLDLATILPLLVLLPLSGIVGVAAQRISGSKDQRVFEPLLVLPFTRTELLLGKALSAWTIGTISLVAVAVPLMGGRAIPIGAGGRSVDVPFTEVGVLLAVGVLLLTLLVAVGVAVGAASRTSAELGSVLQLVTLPIFLMGSFLQFRSETVTALPLLVLPFFGLLLCIRDVGIQALDGAHLAVAASATGLWTIGAFAVAARFLRSERSVLRGTT